MQSYSGLTLANAGADGVPHRVGVLVPDVVGALYAFQGVVIALFARAMGRGGRFLDVSLAQAMTAFQANMLVQAALEGSRPEVLAVPSGTYPAAHGWISLAVINEAQWPPLPPAVGRADLVFHPRFQLPWQRRSHPRELNHIVGAGAR